MLKTTIMKFYFLFITALISSQLLVKGQDTVSTSFNFCYHKDLSDTFGGGALLSGEFTLSKSWYGVGIGYSHFLSHSSIMYQIIIEEDNQVVNIPFDELAIMQNGSIYGLLTPIQKGRLQFDIVLGGVYGKSKNLCFKSLSYTYNLDEKKFTSIEKDYQLIERNCFGYQAGFNISFNVFKKIGFQLSSRVQDLRNGGTFFFVGGGVCFKL